MSTSFTTIVRNNVEIEWAYGLRKGALWAHSWIAAAPRLTKPSSWSICCARRATRQAIRSERSRSTGAQFNDLVGGRQCDRSLSALVQRRHSRSHQWLDDAPTAITARPTSSTITLSHIWVSVTIGGSGLSVRSELQAPHRAGRDQSQHRDRSGRRSGESNERSAGNEYGDCFGGLLRPQSQRGIARCNAPAYGSDLLTYIEGEMRQQRRSKTWLAASASPASRPRAGAYGRPASPMARACSEAGAATFPISTAPRLRWQITKRMRDSTQPIDHRPALYVDEIYGRKLAVETNFVTHASARRLRPPRSSSAWTRGRRNRAGACGWNSTVSTSEPCFCVMVR